MPTARAKADAWRQLVDQDGLPNADQRAMMLGFQQFEQHELLQPYVKRYLAAVGDVYRTRTAEMAQDLIVGLYPTTIATQATVDATDAYLQEQRPAPALRRMLVESRDSLSRALRAQQRDSA